MPDGAERGLFGISLRQRPANPQAEMALLGALLANNRAADRTGDLLAEHFADPANGRIYAAILRRLGLGMVADAVTLIDEFRHAGTLDEVGGPAYLARLLASMVAIGSVADYARAIRDAWIRRQVIDLGEEVVNEAFIADPERTGEVLITEAVERLLALSEQASVAGGGVTLGRALDGAVERAEAAFHGRKGAARLDTGMPTVDALWCGLWPGQLYYLMARSRTGKSPFMAQVARNVAAQLLADHQATGEPIEHVHIISLEMTAEDLATTSLAATSPWTADQLRAGTLHGPDAWHLLAERRRALAELPIIIDDQPDMTIGQLITRVRVVKRTKRTRLLLIDYRELIGRGREYARMTQTEWVPHLGYKLKALAKMIGVPVVALAQVNKSVDKEAVQRPTLGDLPFDGGQAADAVFALHRPELYLPEAPKVSPSVRARTRVDEAHAQHHDERARVAGLAEFGALKRRFGPCGWRDMRFDGPRMLFRECQEPAEAPPPSLWDGLDVQ